MGIVSKEDLRASIFPDHTNEKTKQAVGDSVEASPSPTPSPKVKPERKLESPQNEAETVDTQKQMIETTTEVIAAEKGDSEPEVEKITTDLEKEVQGIPVVASHNVSVLPPKIERLSPEEFPHPAVDGSKVVPPTIDNVKHLLDKYGIKAKYNVIKKEPQFFVPNFSCTSDNADNVTLAHIKSCCRLNGLSVNGLEETLLAIADQKPYNPALDWIHSKPWDGIDRLPEFYDTLTVREGYPAYFRDVLVNRWMISGCAALMDGTGFHARGVLTLQGPELIGKTSWFGSLVPDPALRESAVKLDYKLDAGNKDSQITAATHWFLEIGELDDSFSRGEARLKGFITSDCDKIRLPYARSASTFPRRTVFGASVNPEQFLRGGGRNSRWWIVQVEQINYEHGLDMQQIWAQFAVKYEEGEQWWLNSYENDMLEELNRYHRTISPVAEQVTVALDLSRKDEPGLPAMTATELLKRIGYKNVSNQQAKECGGVLREHLGEPKKINGYMKWRIPFDLTHEYI